MIGGLAVRECGAAPAVALTTRTASASTNPAVAVRERGKLRCVGMVCRASRQVRGISRLEEVEVSVVFPLRDGVVVVPPLAGLELDERRLQLRPEHVCRKRVGVERLHRLEQRPRERGYL